MNKRLTTSVETELKKEIDVLSRDILSMYNGNLIHRFNRYVCNIRVDECIESILCKYDLVKAKDRISLSKIKKMVYQFINSELIAYGEITPNNKIKVE